MEKADSSGFTSNSELAQEQGDGQKSLSSHMDTSSLNKLSESKDNSGSGIEAIDINKADKEVEKKMKASN